MNYMLEREESQAPKWFFTRDDANASTFGHAGARVTLWPPLAKDLSGFRRGREFDSYGEFPQAICKIAVSRVVFAFQI